MSVAEAVERSAILHGTTDFLNTVIENMPALVAVKEARDLRFVLLNRAGEELTGIDRRDWIGKNDFDVFPREQAEAFVARDREVLTSGQMSVTPEEQITTRHKGVRTLRTIKMPVFDAAGVPQYLLAMSDDITEQKRAEAALAASERRWAFALESAGQGVWEADIAGNAVYYSPMWKRIRGYDPAEDVDSAADKWLARVHPDDRERITEIIAKQNSGEIPRNAFEYRERHRDGHYIWISSKGAPDAWDADGRPIRMIGTDTDITARKEQEQELRKLTHRLELALRVSGLGVFESNEKTGELFWDDRVREIFGVDPNRKNLTAADWENALHPEDAAHTLLAFSRSLEARAPFNEKYRIIRGDGAVRTLASDGVFFQDADGTPKYIGACADITERKEQEQQLRDLTQRLQLALRASRIGVFEGNLETGELVWDSRVREIFGVPPERDSLTVADWAPFIHPEDKPRIQAEVIEAVAAKTAFRQQYRIVRPDGTVRTISADAVFYKDADGAQRFVGTNTDITEEVEIAQSLRAANVLAEARNAELEAAKALIEDQSRHDALTGLPNRRYLDKIIAGFAERCGDDAGSGLAVLHIDLDRFKQINDTLGHIAGDAVLRRVAEILLEAAGADNFVARVGGDEFVVVCPNETDAQKLSALADRIIAAVQLPIPYEGHSCRIGASVGIAIAEGTIIDPRRVLISGDMALYRAKARGRNRHEFFSSELQQELETNKRIADDILRGIEQAEFFPYYQPVVDARTCELVGVEALVRWQHPTDGLLAPDRFLRIAEDLNVLPAIDHSILVEAINDLAIWKASGLPIQSVSVNVSFRRLSDEGLVPSLRKLNIEPGTVSFEFLESIFLDELDDRVAWSIDAIKEMGIGIDVDDFGTGHTSVVSLLRLMPRRFKIDRQLIEPVATNEGQRRLVASIVDIGRTLGIKVVAEGVETMEQANVLREIGCDFLQGYAFARPMPAHDLGLWLRKTQKEAVGRR